VSFQLCTRSVISNLRGHQHGKIPLFASPKGQQEAVSSPSLRATPEPEKGIGKIADWRYDPAPVFIARQ
jgi:hypothetical protein